MYLKNTDFVVYCTLCYFKDDWDASLYGQEYNPNKNFFVQFFDLLKKVPQLHIEHTNNNSGDIIFSNYVYRSKNIYLSYGVVRSENIFYSWGSHNGNKNCFDSMDFTYNESCYELVDSIKNYACLHLTRSKNCLDSQYLYDCANCTNCFMSSNLRNQSYVFRNVQYAKEVYFRLLESQNLKNFEARKNLSEEYNKLIKNAIHKYAILQNAILCTGDEITNSKNIQYGFSVQDSENSSYVQITTNTVTDCMDMSMSGRAESCYQLTVCGRGNYQSLCSYNIGNTKNIYYCDGCNNVSNCFGCVGLKNKEYCILNKQYSKEEYLLLVEQIKKDMIDQPYVGSLGRIYIFGDYFPIEFSRFTYNQSMAHEMFPEKKEQILEKGLVWLDNDKKDHEHTTEFYDTQENLADDYEKITTGAFPCENQGNQNLCTKSFKIIKSELDFYIKYNLPLPRKCPNCRYFERKKKKLPWKLWHRTCMCDKTNHIHGDENCAIEFETSYAPDRPEIVYCEKCYQQEVI